MYNFKPLHFHQVRGTKQWTLFPPSDRCHLAATRVPYEESSVYSRLDMVNMARNYQHLLIQVWSTLWQLEPC